MRKRFGKESGSVTIEATISLSAFMFAIVTLLTIVNICVVQAKMSVAINSAAKELSHYSYLYSLTGIPGAKAELENAATDAKKDLDGVLTDVNTVFTEIQNLGNSDPETGNNVEDVLSGLEESYGKISEATGSLKSNLETLAADPKGVAMGLAKIAVTEGWDLATSRLIAAPLAKGLCKKNLVPEKNGNVEAYLKNLGIQPGANGSYLDGLDFSRSSIFANGSNEIRITVSYDVKVIPLLPINFTFHFCQTAVTHGWLAGNESYRTVLEQLEEKGNSTIWTDANVTDRSDLIRHQALMDYGDDGYEKLTGGSYSDVHAYNSEDNEFLAIHSMNPLYSSSGEPTKTLNDISEQAIKEQVEHWCTGLNDSTEKLDTIQTRTTDSSGSSKKNTYECDNSTKKLVIVIPQDEGLQDKLQSIIDECNTHGVEVELVPSYGNGAQTTMVAPDAGDAKEGEGKEE